MGNVDQRAISWGCLAQIEGGRLVKYHTVRHTSPLLPLIFKVWQSASYTAGVNLLDAALESLIYLCERPWILIGSVSQQDCSIVKPTCFPSIYTGYFLNLIVFIWERETHTETEISHLLIHSLNMLATAEAGPSQSQKSVTHSVSPTQVTMTQALKPSPALAHTAH